MADVVAVLQRAVVEVKTRVNIWSVSGCCREVAVDNGG